jgi:hypothetical protein
MLTREWRRGSAIAFIGLLASTLLFVPGCSTYEQRVAPIPLPDQQPDVVSIANVHLIARGYADPSVARSTFGFKIRQAGVLPVQFVVDNQSDQPVRLDMAQTLLVDQAGNGWPLLGPEQAAERIRTAVRQGESIEAGVRGSLLTGLAGAVAGAAVGIVGSEGIGEATGKGAAIGAAAGTLGSGAQRYEELNREIRQDMMRQSIGERAMEPGTLTHGFLFFPGRDEASSVKTLRLRLTIGESVRSVQVPIQPVSPSSG